MPRVSTTAILALAAAVMPSTCWADWDRLKPYLQAGVVIVEEREAKLVIKHPSQSETIVVTEGETAESDIYTVLRWDPGTNPYRVWIATARFWNNRLIPKERWGQFFRTPFLRILRPPPGP